MAKYEKVSEELEELFNEVIEGTSIPLGTGFGLRANPKQKEVCLIRKANELFEEFVEGINFIVLFNEEIFYGLEEEHQKIVIDEQLAGVTVSDNEATGVEKYDFQTYRGVLEKYGHEEIIKIKECVKSLYDAKKEREDAEKASKKKPKPFQN